MGIPERSFDIISTIELMADQLMSSTYNSDKREALEKLQDISINYPREVGTFAMKAIASSINFMDNAEIQLDILSNIFESENGSEFIEMFLINDEGIKELMKAESTYMFKRVLHRISSHAGRILGNIIVRENLVDRFLEHFEIIANLLHVDTMQIFVFCGLIEKINEKLNARNEPLCFKIMLFLLKDPKNVIYFRSINWQSVIEKFQRSLRFEIYNVLLSTAGDCKTEFQDNLFTRENVEYAIVSRKIEFVRLALKDNVSNIANFANWNKIEDVLKLYFIEDKFIHRNQFVELIMSVYGYIDLGLGKTEGSLELSLVINLLIYHASDYGTDSFPCEKYVSSEYFLETVFRFSMIEEISDAERFYIATYALIFLVIPEYRTLNSLSNEIVLILRNFLAKSSLDRAIAIIVECVTVLTLNENVCNYLLYETLNVFSAINYNTSYFLSAYCCDAFKIAIAAYISENFERMSVPKLRNIYCNFRTQGRVSPDKSNANHDTDCLDQGTAPVSAKSHKDGIQSIIQKIRTKISSDSDSILSEVKRDTQKSGTFDI